jgi:hypothetical protein
MDSGFRRNDTADGLSIPAFAGQLGRFFHAFVVDPCAADTKIFTKLV